MTEQLKPYSVLLLWPEWCTDSFGTDTYYEWVHAASPADAVAIAAQKAYESVAEDDSRREDYEFEPLLVTEGHHFGVEL